MKPFAIAVHVGPEDIELDRLSDLAASVKAWEPGGAYWVLIDDSPVERDLIRHARLPAGCDAVSLRSPRRRADTRRRMTLGSGTLLAVSQVQARTNARFVLKIDTDALMIRSLADALDRTVDRVPEAGLIGTVGDSCNPEFQNPGKLDRVSSLVRLCHMLPPPPAEIEDPNAIVEVAGLGPATVAQLRTFAIVRPHIEHAVAQGYLRLEYCQGGAYAVTRAFMDRMAGAGYFETLDAWGYIPVNEDVMMGMYARAVGLRLVDGSGEGEPFGIQYRGLAYEPGVLVARQHCVIHSLKNDRRHSEEALRSYFAKLRAPARCAPPSQTLTEPSRLEAPQRR